ncbi:MAG: mandelate racemase/muconate lactonizing enzyme family protein [Gammaproteobacteria bacterium]|nr:MAG: mandelate racemase/muconate lactonizing enzyme family protein [Gammaproteobacteria bacterium]
MKIATVEAIPLEIPFSHGGKPFGWGGQAWTRLSILLVRVETENGLVGYGEAFSYACRRAVQAAVEDMIAPLAIGCDAGDIVALNQRLQRELHLQGRHGLTIFALSGLDIALWDIAGKAAGLPLHRLLGAAGGKLLPGYASLYRYRDAEIVAERCQAATRQGYRWIKLHEIAEAEVAAAREVLGNDVPIMVDTNCPWTPAQARRHALAFKPYGIHWLEEPIFPPEDFASLARLQKETGVPLAAGENACTSFDFQKMFSAGAVTYAQPSVTKVGGISEFLKVAALARTHGVEIMPHCPYFGPGFPASLQLGAVLPEGALIERLYVDLEARLYGDLIDAEDGNFRVPDGPGLGVEPDADVIERYRIRDA